jgi:glutamate-5-semialdehyde dehydrogenase
MIFLDTLMNTLGLNARKAATALALADTRHKNAALNAIAKHIRANAAEILQANAKDVAAGSHLAPSFIDRLTLTPARIEAIAVSVEEIALLDDPVGSISAEFSRPNGLQIQRVRVPLGVIGVIYESRPNVTADAGALCLKSGNAVILRGGSDSFHSSNALVHAIKAGLKEAGIDENAIQLVPTTDRAAVGMMLTGLNGTIDVIIPRGGKSLVKRVQDEARVPVFAHLEGNNHVYVHSSASEKMAIDVLINSKLRRTGVCGSAETLLAHENHAPALIKSLLDKGCEVRGCVQTQRLDNRVLKATDEDYATEFLDSIIAVKIVTSHAEAINHIEAFGSHHTDAIIAEDAGAVSSFFKQVTSAIVLHNASTQFADGGEFGFGAEIGIATGRMHARGPVGVEQLTTFNYHVHGTGQTRP